MLNPAEVTRRRAARKQRSLTPREQGAQADSLTACPYTPNTHAYREFREGWRLG